MFYWTNIRDNWENIGCIIFSERYLVKIVIYIGEISVKNECGSGSHIIYTTRRYIRFDKWYAAHFMCFTRSCSNERHSYSRIQRKHFFVVHLPSCSKQSIGRYSFFYMRIIFKLITMGDQFDCHVITGTMFEFSNRSI